VKEPTLRFGNRFEFDPAFWESRWRRYFAHLSAHGFNTDDLAYPLFAAEVFHDSPIIFAGDLDRRHISLSLINTYAYQEVSRRVGAKVEQADFLTTIGFADCQFCSIDLRLAPENWYQCAELSRVDDKLRLVIACSWNRSDGDCDSISIVAKQILVTDIVDKIAMKYHLDASRLISPISHEPDFYLAQEHFRLQCEE